MAETGQTRITSFGGNPTTYNNNSARILKGRDVTILRPEGGIEHRMYDDGTMTRVDNRTGEFIPVPEEYDAYWRNAFEQAQTNARPNLLQRGVHWVGRGIEKAGNWLQRFEDGGTTQQVASPEQDVMNTIEAAIGEIQTKRPGQAVQKLAAMMQDPNYSMIIDMIKQEYPQIEGILNTVEQMVGAFKCGGKTKKKVKKGAKGCVPCKKLMKVGGKLVNVWSDCEGNIISKHQTGGWLIPKGQVGLTAQFVQEPYRKAKASTDAGNANDVHYYLGDDNKIYTQTYTTGTGWGAGKLADMNNFKNWATTANTSGQILGKNFFVNGFNFDYNTNMGIMSEADAQAAGIDGSKYATAGKVVDGVVGAGGNDLYGIEAKDPTKRDALNQRGLSPILNATFIQQNAANALAKENFRTQRRAVLKDKNLWGKGYLKNARNTKNTIIAQNNAEASKDRAAWMTEFGHMNTPSNTTPVEVPKYQPAEGTTPAADTTTGYQPTSAKYKKQGGWLTKFQDGGTTEPKLSEYKFHRREITTPAGYSVIQEGFYPTYSFGNKTGITYDFDDSPRWGRNIYVTPHGNDTVYYHTSDPYEYLDMYPTTYIQVGTPYKSQQAAKKGWHNMLHGTNIPVRPQDGDEAAFNRAKKEK